ncbi:MAG TPA: hypothetical protein VK737_00830 [Opitutales bacterium]|jgi:hypothetical protein|nr:hypothetical protein [Opitutales bacterium]
MITPIPVARLVTGPRDPAATQRAADAELKVDHLEREVHHLSLVCDGLWSLLREKLGYTDAELIAHVSAVEAKEYGPDGTKKASTPRQCPKCQRVAMRYHSTCAYCGEHLTPSLFE